MRNEQQNRRKVSNSSGYSSRLESLPPRNWKEGAGLPVSVR